MTIGTRELSAGAQNINWMLRDFVNQTAGVQRAVAVSSDGLLVAMAGALMLTPGFVTDAIGLLCLFPPTRAIIRTALIARYRDRIKVAGPGGAMGGAAGGFGPGFGSAGGPAGGPGRRGPGGGSG